MVLAGKSGEGDTFLPSLDQIKFKKKESTLRIQGIREGLCHITISSI